MLFWIVVLMLLLPLFGAGYHRYGALGTSPAGVILLVLVVLYLTGNLNL